MTAAKYLQTGDWVTKPRVRDFKHEGNLMGDIGKPLKHIELEPLEEPATVPAPVEVPVEEPVPA